MMSWSKGVALTVESEFNLRWSSQLAFHRSQHDTELNMTDQAMLKYADVRTQNLKLTLY